MTKFFRCSFAAILTVGSALCLAQGRVISRLRPGANPTAIAQQFGISFREQAPGAPFFLFVVPSPLDLHAVENQMMSNPDVVWAEDDDSLVMPESTGGGKGSTVAVVNDRGRAYSMNTRLFDQIGFRRSQTLGAGRSVRVAVLDTGLSPTCAILWSKTVYQYNAVDRFGVAYDVPRGVDSNGNGTPDEGVGHGTFVAGIVDQMSPGSRLVVVRVADSDGVATAWSLVKGLSYAVKTRCEVANLSLGASHTIPALSDVMEWAQAAGTFAVAAAGNDNLQLVYEPAGISKVLAVTGVDAADHKALFANYDGKIEACAPATGILSYGPAGQMMVWSGTSFAAPLLAGSIAECLRHTSGPVTGDTLYSKVKASGTSIDVQNPNYRGKMGKRLWIPSLITALRGL